MVRLTRLFWRIPDAVDYGIISLRLRFLDWVWGSEPPTGADRQREQEHERLQKAFPKIDIDGRGSER
jgi:hypothetical protein